MIRSALLDHSDGTESNASVTEFLAMSANGPFVVFASNASNFVTGDTNGFVDIFVACTGIP